MLSKWFFGLWIWPVIRSFYHAGDYSVKYDVRAWDRKMTAEMKAVQATKAEVQILVDVWAWKEVI